MKLLGSMDFGRKENEFYGLMINKLLRLNKGNKITISFSRSKNPKKDWNLKTYLKLQIIFNQN